MGQPTGAELHAQLRAAERDQTLVRLTRSIKRSDSLDGFVVGVGDEWVLLAVLDDLILLNGYVAVRAADISKVECRGGTGSFVGRALRIRRDWPPVGIAVALDGTAALIRTAAKAWPLVTLHFEIDNPTVCYVGRPVGYTTRSVEWLDLDADAEWSRQRIKRPLARVTRVEFGGRYEDALHLVGGPPPK